MKINNRRYIGCKTKLLDFIYKTVSDLGYGNNNSFADIFAGTGVVAYKFAENGYKTIINDNLYSNYVIYKALFGKSPIRIDLMKSEIDMLNKLDSSSLDNNYFSNVYGNKYYSVNDAKKIGHIRDYIEDNKNKYNEREYFYLISCLLYAIDKTANTVGHFESFLKRIPADRGVELELFSIDENLEETAIYNEDANQLVRHISADIVYIDPPYNARQYVNFYHVLENVARWNKPVEFEGNSMKFKRDELKSGYCRTNTATKLFEDLIDHAKCKLIVVSYNNTYKAGSISSVNTISSDDIIRILKKHGKVTVKEKDYNAFNAGKTDMDGHKELLYICEVNV